LFALGFIQNLNSNKINLLKKGIFIFPIFFISILIIQQIFFGPLNEDYRLFIREDGPIEYLTSFFFFLSFLFSIFISINFFRMRNNIFAIFFIALAIIFILIGFEEISWGQRIIGKETPEIFSENLQSEITIHNLPSIQPHIPKIWILVSFIGSFFWLIYPKLKRPKLQIFWKFFIPNSFLISYFLPVFAFFTLQIIPSYIVNPSEGYLRYIFHSSDQEPIEFILALGIGLFVITKYLTQINYITSQKIPLRTVLTCKQEKIVKIILIVSFSLSMFFIIEYSLSTNTEIKLNFVNEVKVPKTIIYERMADVENYIGIFPDNVRSIEIINRTENSLLAKENLGVRWIETTVLVKHKFIPFSNHQIEILSGDANGTTINLTFENINSGTKIYTDLNLKLSGFPRIFASPLSESNFQSAVTTVIDTFAQYSEKD